MHFSLNFDVNKGLPSVLAQTLPTPSVVPLVLALSLTHSQQIDPTPTIEADSSSVNVAA